MADVSPLSTPEPSDSSEPTTSLPTVTVLHLTIKKYINHWLRHVYQELSARDLRVQVLLKRKLYGSTLSVTLTKVSTDQLVYASYCKIYNWTCYDRALDTLNLIRDKF